jgi:DNA polymerase III delta prime subunit
MSEPVASATSSYNSSVPTPWWVRLCRWLWKISAFLGGSVMLVLVVSVFATWLTNPGGVIPANSHAGWLIARWPVTLLIGGCFLLLALLTGVLSHWPAQAKAPLSPAQQDRVRMLRRLRRSYSDVLAQSLQGDAWMELGIAHQPDAVQNATTLLYRSHRAEQLLPPGTPITQAYEEAAYELLILGEPGTGKSTLLLQLAQQLVERAEQDDAQPLPVLLPLSSWAVTRPPLQDWLAEQVAQLYDIPEQLALRWVQEERLLPLLDGLDEMEETARPACIVAINAYHHAHPGPLVVCSRKAEYEEAARHHRLTLQSAVVVQPLSHEQTDAYLAHAGKPLIALRRALNKNPGLRELASTPLMLSVLMLTYQGTSVRIMSQKEAELQRQVWTDYMQRMVERKGNAGRYPLERARAWLHWLAHEIREHNQVVFYLEHLQPDWLPAGQQLAYTWLAIRIPGMLIGVLASLIITLFLGYQNPASLLQFGVLGGFLGGLFSETAGEDRGFQRAQSHPRPTTRRVIMERTVTSALIGLAYGLSFGLDLYSGPYYYYGPGDWLRDGSISGVVIGLSCCLLMFLLPRFSSREIQASATHTARRWPDLRRLMHTWHGQRALLVAAVLGAGSGLSYGLHYGLRYGLLDGLLNGLFYGLSAGLLFGLISVLVSLVLGAQTGDVHLTERLRWNWRSLIRSLLTPRHLRSTVLFASIVLVLVGLSYGLGYGLGYGLNNGLSNGLFYGLRTGLLFGLFYGLSAGLSYWLLLGLFQGISHERVENQDRRVFNQGIRRSLRNSGIMGVISGGVIGAMGILSAVLILVPSAVLYLTLRGGLTYALGLALSNGLNFALSNGLNYALRYGWLLAVSGGLLVCAVSGGLAVVRHAVLRLLLWRTHTFPWQAAPFLEDATSRILLRRVGGGYSFMHRLLLDYFA